MRRIAELDGLRGIAAVLIVAYHLCIDSLPGCWAAVDVFFVLSGFLITNILLRHELSCGFLAAFYARRGLRIWPIYYLLITVLVVTGLYEPSALPYYLTYTQQLPRYWGGAMPMWLAIQHTWTLALEEQFYLIWPVLVFLVGRRSSQPIGDLIGLGPGLALWTAECILTLVVAVLSWHLIERPILRFKNRLPYERGATVEPWEASRRTDHPPLDAVLVA